MEQFKILEIINEEINSLNKAIEKNKNRNTNDFRIQEKWNSRIRRNKQVKL